MASRKQITLLALAGLIATASFGQRNDASYSWVLDSSKRSVKNMPQQNEFMNNAYPYPSKPNNQWELSITGGNSFIIGDRPGSLKEREINGVTNGAYVGGYNAGISLRKALGHIISVRGGYYYSSVHVPGYRGYVPFTDNQTHMVGLDLIASLNTVSHYRGDPKVNFYALLGYDIVASKVQTGYSNPKVLYYPSNNLIGTFGGEEVAGRKEYGVYHGISYGGGVAFKLSDRFNIALEERLTAPLLGNDYLDGFAGGSSGDQFAFSNLRLNFNLGSASKSVQPLWWINPNNYLYNEVNAPQHMKMPPVVLPDADGDGVTDQFDMEPNTPAGAPVDSHGVSLDTDGDGVPDYRDKEKLTPRECFPVDADGVGKCPEPACCAELRDKLTAMPAACDLGAMPSVQFKSGSLTLSSTAKAALNNIAQQMNANPSCNVRVSGYYSASNKRSQQLAWDRVNTVIKYLSQQQGISESRLIWNISSGGDPNTVDVMGTTETGPNTIPAPFPNLQKSK